MAAGAGTTITGVTTFGSVGAEQTFVVPEGVTSIGVVAVGGRGGDGGPYFVAHGGQGGFGARVRAQLEVTPGQVLYIRVGGNGVSAVVGSNAAAPGGFNGGGSGGSNGGAGVNGGAGSGGGGGATDIRLCPGSHVGACPGGVPNTLASRILVAGGGGGAGGATCCGAPQPDGGDGGSAGAIASGEGEPGSDGANAAAGGGGGGGTSDAPGAPGVGRNGGPNGSPGVLADGGTGASNPNAGGAGGGGGGYWGGGGGGAGFGSGGGGAGSSLVPDGGELAVDSTGVPSVVIYHAPPVIDAGDLAAEAGETTAALNGTVDPRGQDTTYRFEYGETPALGKSTEPVEAGWGTAGVPAAAELTGLKPGTTYHYRLVATNPIGTSVSAIHSFATGPRAPAADLRLRMTASPGRLAAGGRVRYALEVANKGPDRATNVRITGTLPRGQSFRSGSRPCAVNRRRVMCSFAALPVGASRRLTVVARAKRTGRQAFNAKATAAEPDPRPRNSRATARVRVRP